MKIMQKLASFTTNAPNHEDLCQNDNIQSMCPEDFKNSRGAILLNLEQNL
jgi:hypothetical protein